MYYYVTSTLSLTTYSLNIIMQGTNFSTHCNH